jgi:hypothetical protein
MTRRLPPINPHKESLVDSLTCEVGPVNDGTLPRTEVTIDDLIIKGKSAIEALMRLIASEIRTGVVERDTVMNLKDCMAMLFELKKKEKEFFANATDEELEKYLNK